MAVVNDTGRQKSVGDPTSEYLSIKDIWDRNRAVCSGERYTKDYDSYLDVINYRNLLIPFSPSMSPDQYKFYKAEAELPGIVAQFIKMLIGGLLRKQPVLELPESVPDEAYNWILEEFSTDGAPMTAFLDEILWEEMQTSHAWIYVSYPKIDTEDLSREERLAIKPFPTIWQADTVINVRYKEENGGNKLQHVITRGFVDDYEEGNFHPVSKETVWVHYLDNSGYYTVDMYQLESEDSKTLLNGRQINTPEMSSPQFIFKERIENIKWSGERLNFIPAWPANGTFSMKEPVITPLVDKEVSLYNKMSRRNHLLYGASTYTPVIMSDMTDEEFHDIVSAGLGSWLKLRSDDDAKVLDTPTAALADMDRAIAGGIEEMAKLGVRMMSPETAQSGVALELRNAAQTAQLGTLNNKISSVMRQVIATMIQWRYGIEVSISDVSFTLSADFNPVPIGADWLRLATEWYREGLIPRTIWLNILKQNDMLPSEYDDEDGVQEINSDELILTDTGSNVNYEK